MKPIIVQYLEDNVKPDRWQLIEPIDYTTTAGPVRVPAGYITDFASSPMLLWWVFPPIGRHNRDCILHDYWYDNRLFEAEYGQEVARKMADQQLLRGLNACQPGWKWRNYMMYLACRLFGKSWWVN